MMNHGWVGKTFLATITALLVIVSGIGTSTAGPVTGSLEQTLVKGLQDQGARIGRNPRSGRVVFIGTDHDKGLALPGMGAGLLPKDNARAALSQYAYLFGIQSPDTELKSMRQLNTPDGRSMVRFQQVYQGLPVIGGEIIVNIDAAGRMSSMNGEARPGLGLDPTPTLAATDAQAKALEAVAATYNVAASHLTTTPPTLSIYAPELIGPRGPGPVLVWRMDVTSLQDMIDEFVLVDARRGNVALHFSQMEHAKNRKTYDGTAVTVPSQLPGTLLCSEATADNCTGGSDLDADTASLYAGDTYDFYFNNFGRDSIDGKGMVIKSSVHLNIGCPNAAWVDAYSQMVYCTGMPEGDDVDGHELTHGVTSRTSNLFYWYQSGAINESLSDVFGEFIDLTNGRGAGDVPGAIFPGGTRWEMGEGASIGVIRDMWDPTRFGDPDKMTSANYYTGILDGGGVHTNSGVNNHAAALMVDGGNFNFVTVASLGIPKVAQVYYEVQTHLLTSGSDYYDLYNALFQGCKNLVGTHGITNADCLEVQKATQAVEMDLEPTAGFNPDAGFCPTPNDVPSNLFFDGFEGGGPKLGAISGWSAGGANAGRVWQVDAPTAYFPGPYAASGSHSLYADDVYLNNDSYIAMSSGATIPSGGLYLRFDQAFGFNSGSNGGARLEYSIDNGAYSNASGLFDAGQDYNGTASAGVFSGQGAWVNDSHGYVSSRYHITTNVGSNIKFRFRLGTGTFWNYGWWIDNVRLYTCVANTAPTAPVLVSPSDGATNIDSTASIDFKWKKSTDIDGDTINYNLKVCTDAGFTTCVTNITKSAATAPFAAASMGGGISLLFASMLIGARRRKLGAALAILSVVGLLASCGGGGGSSSGGSITYTVPASTLSAATTYYWHVTADDGNLGTTTSSDWSFTTLP